MADIPVIFDPEPIRQEAIEKAAAVPEQTAKIGVVGEQKPGQRIDVGVVGEANIDVGKKGGWSLAGQGGYWWQRGWSTGLFAKWTGKR